MSDMNGPIFALGGVIVGAILNNFFGEDYRRHKDSTALAAALSGELKGHFIGAQQLSEHLKWLVKILNQPPGTDVQILFRPAEIAGDPIFEANAAKIGLLGAHFAHEAAYAYQMISAFRSSYKVTVNSWHDMSTEEKVNRVKSMLNLIDSNMPRATETVQDLKAYAETGTMGGWIRRFSLWQLALKRWHAFRAL